MEKEEIETPAPSLASKRDIDSEPFCALIQKAHGEGSTLQIIFERDRLWQTKSRRNSLSIQKQKDITLKEFLTASSTQIPLREKWRLAVIFAHAALHGSGSPWLSDEWSKEHISFFRQDNAQKPDLRRPFLKIDLDESKMKGERAKNLFVATSSLESLGILLLEIVSDNPIETKYAREDLTEDGKPNAYTNVTTALRLLEEMEDTVYDGYRAAVRACLDAEMLSSESGEHFSQKLYEKVVLPLERELENGFHLKPEQFGLCS